MRFGLDALVAARLYTGPMFVKYNGVLRGMGDRAPPFFQKRFYELCLGNTYPATLHAINAALTALSQLTIATTVYRGISGGALPSAFREPDEFACKGGCELGFMSTTYNRKQHPRHPTHTPLVAIPHTRRCHVWQVR